MLDNIDYDVFSTEQLAEYSNALNTIADSLTVVNGKIYANGEAVESVAKLQELSVQASIEATKQELINKRTELEAAKAVVDAKIAELE